MKIKILLTLICALFITQLYSQEATVASGGNSAGVNGNLSYTVGQVIYTTHFGSNGSIVQGVQQPFEIQTLLGLDNININLQLSVYPNPTANLLSLDVKNYNFENLQYQLFDINGRIILFGKIVQESTQLQLDVFPAAIYLLKVTDNNKEIKTFKIIKKDNN